MPRLRHLVLAFALLLAATIPAAVQAASPEGGTVVRVELELIGSDGFDAHLETSEDETVKLEVAREGGTLANGGSTVTYEVQGEVTETGLKVRFGRLGLIDVSFTPTRTLGSTAPGEGCTGAPRTLSEGTFTGTIDFTGEREYVRVQGPRAEGTMSVISQWECPPPAVPHPLVAASRQLAPSPRAQGGERETASLHADSRRCSCFFAAGVHHRHSGGRSIFYGVKAERREGMEILRATWATGPAAAFDYDHGAGTATLDPPQPLRGHATLTPRLHGRDLWRSTIRVPLLGTDPLRVSGREFRAGLYPEYHFD